MCECLCVRVADLASVASDNCKQTSNQLCPCGRRINDHGAALQALTHLSLILYLKLRGRTCHNSIRFYLYQFYLSMGMCILAAEIHSTLLLPQM